MDKRAIAIHPPTTLSQSANGPASEAQIILAARLGPNATVLRQVLETQAQVRIEPPTVAAVPEAIRTEAALVVLTEEVLTDVMLAKQLGDYLSQQPDWSDIPVIILLSECQRFTDCLALLGQTTHHRSVLLLELPLQRPIFASIVRSCLQNRQRQYELRNTLYQLKESNQALENFSYTAAHELRNPLGSITTGFDLLARADLAPKQQKIVEMGQRTSQRMNQMIGALLNYSKVQARTDQFAVVNMNSVVKEAIASLQVLINTRNAEVTSSDLPMVHGHYQLLIQLVSNLIKNAIVHNDSAVPTVTIAAQSQSEAGQSLADESEAGQLEDHPPDSSPTKLDRLDRCLFTISDNGPGIAPEVQEEIFEMFNRAGKKSRTEGNGIGLALCRRVAQQHESTLRVSSVAGEGSTFYFQLAIAQET